MAGDHVIQKDGIVEGIAVGDPMQKVFDTFSASYRVQDTTPSIPGHVKTVTVMHRNKQVITFEIENERVFLMHIFDEYVTAEHIGCGSTLSSARRAYGHGRLVPTDSGYLLTFKKIPWMSFLLKNGDIPEKLQGIPDDLFSEEDEKQILALGKIRIASIEIFK
jgi:hypothetical protein